MTRPFCNEFAKLKVKGTIFHKTALTSATSLRDPSGHPNFGPFYNKEISGKWTNERAKTVIKVSFFNKVKISKNRGILASIRILCLLPHIPPPPIAFLGQRKTTPSSKSIGPNTWALFLTPCFPLDTIVNWSGNQSFSRILKKKILELGECLMEGQRYNGHPNKNVSSNWRTTQATP